MLAVQALINMNSSCFMLNPK